MFLFDAPTYQTMQLGSLTVSPFFIPQQEGQFDLGLEMMEIPNNLLGNLKYKTMAFNRPSIQRMIGHFKHIVDQILRCPDMPVSAIALTTPKEQQTLSSIGSGDHVPIPNLCIHDLFQQQAQKTPHHVAVVMEDNQLTYEALDQQSTQLAIYLQTQGVQPDSVVGVRLHRSIDMIITILGILKAGGAYLPIDPECPQKRQDFMLQECQAICLITADWLKERQPAIARGKHGLRGGGREHSLREGEPRIGKIGHTPTPGLCHLHIRLDRTTQGGDGETPVRCQPGHR